jgi:heparinase II/III-like protein
MKFITVLLVMILLPLLACGDTERSAGSGDAAGTDIRQLIERRAAEYADDEVLVADFYRIYRKLAYPLPVVEIHHPNLHVTGIQRYPWEIWMTWDLEQRVFSLGWSAQWTTNEHYRELVRRDLAALAGWPRYDAREQPHLAGAHAARLMVAAYQSWDWLGEDIRAKIREGLHRFVDSYPEWLGDGRLELDTAGKAMASSGRHLHNIPTIAIIGRSMAARICDHPLRDKLERHAEALIMAQLKLRGMDYTEAVAYDGYILDFVADWLHGAREEFRTELLARDELELMLEQSWIIAAPGNLMNVAPLNDVEPREMPFHASAHAKLATLRRATGRESWYLQNIPLEWLRSDALAALDGVELPSAAKTPPAGVAEGLYAITARSGWASNDLAVVISASESSVGHIQKDNGTLLIGAGGHWLIDDPGYQQYVPGLEREFTLGPTAHNYPVIGTEGVQSVNKVKRMEVEQQGGLLCMALDITGGYDKAAGVSTVIRKVWQVGDSLVVVVDLIRFESGSRDINYHWQANPDAALWCGDGSVRIVLEGESLWVSSAGYPLEGQRIKRLPGTRGQLTIGQSIPVDEHGKNIWWVFKRGAAAADYKLNPDGESITVAGLTLSAR